jgi:lactate dehydrogenase-like 2-hydroxyacid dehydrogenase
VEFNNKLKMLVVCPLTWRPDGSIYSIKPLMASI